MRETTPTTIRLNLQVHLILLSFPRAFYHISRYLVIAEHVKTRTSEEVGEIAALIEGYGSIEQYILHLHTNLQTKKQGITKAEIKDDDVIFGQGISINQSYYKGVVL